MTKSEVQVDTILLCWCGKRVIRIPFVEVEFIDPKGEISAVCGEHAENTWEVVVSPDAVEVVQA